jgi:hypothetical protein
MDERIDRAAEAFARALLKHPMLAGMIRQQMALWKIPTIVEGNTDEMIDRVAEHLHMQRVNRARAT